MSNLIEDAVRGLRDLPEDFQQAARAIIDYGAGYDDDLQLSDEQVAEVERPIASFLSLAEVRTCREQATGAECQKHTSCDQFVRL